MTSIASPLPAASSLSVTPVSAPVVATVDNPSVTLLNSVLNQPISGTVLASAAGTLTLATDIGTLQLQTAAVLQAGLDVIAQALPGQTAAATTLTLRLFDGQGKPLVAAAPLPPVTTSQTAASPLAPGLASVEDSVSLSAAGRNAAVPATVLRAPGSLPMPLPFADGNAPPPLPAGTHLSVRLLTLTLPGAIVEPDGAPPPPQAMPVVPHSEAPIVPEVSDLPEPSPMQVGDHVTLGGTVAGNTLAGQPLILTDRGLLALPSGTDLPAGAKVALDAVVTALPEPTPTPGPAPMISGPFPALAQLIGRLAAEAPEAAASLLAHLPTDDAHLLATAAVALKAADSPAAVREWLTAAITAPVAEVAATLAPDGTAPSLSAAPHPTDAHRSLIERAITELMPPAVPLRDTSGEEWQMRTLPFLIPSQGLDRATLLTRRNTETEEDSGGGRKRLGRGYRLLVNLDLSRLGALQIDGLYIGEDRRLDMVVRTDKPLPPEVRQGLLSTFATTTEALSLKGGVLFRSGDPFVGPALSRQPVTANGWIA